MNWHPDRTRISCLALPASNTCAVFLKENRMQFIEATGLHRKSGEVEGHGRIPVDC
jgi:hypothetical protein